MTKPHASQGQFWVPDSPGRRRCGIAVSPTGHPPSPVRAKCLSPPRVPQLKGKNVDSKREQVRKTNLTGLVTPLNP